MSTGKAAKLLGVSVKLKQDANDAKKAQQCN